MAGIRSERRRDELERLIIRLEAELGEAKRERRAIVGGFGRGRSRVDRARDSEIAERYRPIAGSRDLVGGLAKELNIPIHQLSRIARRDAAHRAKRPGPVNDCPDAPAAEELKEGGDTSPVEPRDDPRDETWNEWFRAVNFASRTLVGDLNVLLRMVRKRQWPDVEAGIPPIQRAMQDLQELAQERAGIEGSGQT